MMVSPTYRESREVCFSLLEKNREILDPAIETVHSSLLKVKFVNGSLLYFKGAENTDGLRGYGITYLVLDEFAFASNGLELWDKVLRPSLADRQGKCLMISSPNGRNHFYNIYNRKDYSKYLWPTIINPLITDDELAKIKAEVSEIDFQQEYEAKFITKSGQVYSDFEEENIIDEIGRASCRERV